MSLTTAQIYAMRREVGNTPDDADLQDIVDRYVATGLTVSESMNAAVLEILEIRLADFEASPASFTAIGEYSQSVESNLVAMREHLARLRGELDDTSGLSGGGLALRKPTYRPR